MIYFIQMQSGPIKIGFTKSLTKRLSTIKVSSPEPIALLGVMEGKQTKERWLHEQFAVHRLQGEWFSPAPEVLAYVKDNTLDHRLQDEIPDSHSFPKKIVDDVKYIGDNIRKARVRRGITAELLAERIGVSRPTLRAIERGSPNVTIGSYALALFSLDLLESLHKVGEDDVLGRKLQDAALPQRARAIRR